MRAFIAAFMILTATPAIGAKYDLSCKVWRYTQMSNNKDDESSGTIDLRIDTDSMQWCEQKCGDVRPIAKITDETLTLENNPYSPNQNYDVFKINRRSGKIDRIAGISGVFATTATTLRPEDGCKRRPFSGFPARRF